MIIVTGNILAKPEHLRELVAISLEHVRRSRSEPGCVSHAVHRDEEDPLHLVFVEEWADREALLAHFAVPASRAFVKSAAAFAAGPLSMKIYEAAQVKL